MQPAEGISVSRRPLDVEDYIDIARRHKGWIMGPVLFTMVASVVGVYLWPDSYVSQAMVKIVPQQVPENMVQSAINQQMNDRINSMSQTILSRTTLTTIINNFNLYQRQRGSMPIDDVIEEMKKKISILPVNSLGATAGHTAPAFAVQFSYDNRLLAQRVVQDLVSRFIDENIRNRSNASFQTTQFMKDEMDQAKKELDEAENKLAAFRMQNNGRLPDQVDSNMRQLSAQQAQVTYLGTAISRANQDKLQMESNLRILRDQLAAMNKEPVETAETAVTAGPAPAPKDEKLAEAEREVQNWETQLSVLRQHYKDTYPDVQTVIGRLALAKQRRDDILNEENQKKAEAAPPPAPAPKPVNPQTVREAREMDANIRRIQSSIEAKDLELQEYNRELKRSDDSIKAYQGRMETLPMGEKQYGDLLRDREITKEKYIELDAKLGKAQIAQEMEGRKQGETLELLDPASLPINPTEPKRPLVISLGAALGLLLGVVIAAAREMKDTSLKNLKDVRAYTQMAILGSIPLLENDLVVKRRKRMAWLGWTTACLGAAVVISGSIVYYYVTKV
jgi:succinoglycan biosynthesis transport protein ExoP